MSARGSKPSSGGVKLPQIKNAADARELEEEAAARALARKPKAALTPAEKRAAKLRQEQVKEEAAAAKKLKDLKLAEMKARRQSGGSLPDSARAALGGKSAEHSPLPSGRQSAEGLRGSDSDAGGSASAAAAASSSGAGAEADDVEFIENPDGTFTAVTRPTAAASQAAQDDLDEAAAQALADASAPAAENYDIVLEGPKSPLILATIARHMHEVMRLIQDVPIEYRVEFVNAYDEHGCSAIFFALGPDHADVMQLLLDYGSEPNHQNNKKNSPLHVSCAIQNKRAIRVLIEHGANIMLENWQYQKPHEMVTQRDKVSSTQAYLNQCLENYNEKIANKELHGNVTRHQRSYYRSIYDIADLKQLGVQKYESLEPMMDASSMGLVGPRADVKWIMAFFSSWDQDKNGVISFPEWLHRIMTVLNEREKLKKKLKRRQMLAAKRKKKKELEAAQKAGSVQPQAPVPE